jgi:hypothetical protein
MYLRRLFKPISNYVLEMMGYRKKNKLEIGTVTIEEVNFSPIPELVSITVAYLHFNKYFAITL